MSRTIKWLTLVTCLGMFLVLIAGVTVTKTGSGRGCGGGAGFPLCNGKFIPAYTLESIIEYSHRAITGVEGILILMTFVAIYRKFGRRDEAYFYASGALIFTLIQAVLGAMAVIWETSSAVLALHFGISLLAFTFTFLIVLRVWRNMDNVNMKLTTYVQPFYRKLVWFIAIYTYVVVYLGAYVRHTKSAGGCSGWPLCNGEIIPELSGSTGIAFIHRLAAMILFLLIVWIAVLGSRRYNQPLEISRLSLLALILTILQVLSGAWVTNVLYSENMYVFAGLVHTMIISALFAVIGYMCIRTWQLRMKMG
ncbi:MAG: COX15/CtaA family protein [Paenibacillaceae bacterium]